MTDALIVGNSALRACKDRLGLAVLLDLWAPLGQQALREWVCPDSGVPEAFKVLPDCKDAEGAVDIPE